MTGHENLSMGRKAESIYTAMEKKRRKEKKKKAVFSVDSFEKHLKKNAASKACYVFINGISMPVLSA